MQSIIAPMIAAVKSMYTHVKQ